ncbi:MAG: hypothetical protein HYV27_15875 [Candidatus Hydrogenedentes bacterium]|nr:hypothetical protein [Candidatus Hydrogenedentota bacterium]
MDAYVPNLLNQKVDYRFEESAFGLRRSFLYPNGRLFTEYQSSATLLGWPLIHITRGICPETGRHIVARGWFAVGRVAVGGIAVGHVAAGAIAIGQASVGLLAGIGQLTFGAVALGQAAIGLALGVGQFVTGYFAFGQFAFGVEVWGQITRTLGG